MHRLTPLQANECRLMIRAATNIVITAHKNPDGDAVGSILAMHHYLETLGKSSVCILPDEIPGYLTWLPGSGDVRVFSADIPRATAEIDKADLIFILDYNALSRTGEEMEKSLSRSPAKVILIDHHHSPSNFPGVIYSDVTACSTTELIYHFIDALGDKEKINRSVAECIYCGLVTDSGSFRFPSVSAGTHIIVADLLSRGVDHSRIHREIFDNNILDRIRLVGYATSEKLVVMEECSAAYISLSADELNKFNFRPGDTEGLANQALSVQGVKFAAFFREGTNEIKVSFRSYGNFDVNKFARRSWQGGGHTNAAGGTTAETLEQAIERFKKEVSQHCDEISKS